VVLDVLERVRAERAVERAVGEQAQVLRVRANIRPNRRAEQGVVFAVVHAEERAEYLRLAAPDVDPSPAGVWDDIPAHLAGLVTLGILRTPDHQSFPLTT